LTEVDTYFLKWTGRAIEQEIKRVRLETAKRLLIETDYSVAKKYFR